MHTIVNLPVDIGRNLDSPQAFFGGKNSDDYYYGEQCRSVVE